MEFAVIIKYEIWPRKRNYGSKTFTQLNMYGGFHHYLEIVYLTPSK